MTALAPTIRCREITPDDLGAVADLLASGFAGRPRDYWSEGLRRQAEREVPAGYPRFGYMIDHQGAPVGVLLQLYTERGSGGSGDIRCNLSSWYVAPAFRNYASMLTRIAQRLDHVTYFNISPARWTWPIIEAQRFRCYCRGLFISFPLLSRRRPGTHVDTVSADAAMVSGLSADDAACLIRHARYGCLSLVVRTGAMAVPLVLQPLKFRGGRIAPPAMRLIFCRDVQEYVASAGAVGRHLLRRGRIAVAVDANGPIPGLAGFYTERRGRKYCKGPAQPRLGDLSDTELAIYGP